MAETDPCRLHEMSSATYCVWKVKLGWLYVSDVKRMWALLEENVQIAWQLADTMFERAGLKDLLSKRK